MILLCFRKLAVKLGSPVLSEIFVTCDGKDVNEYKRAIPMDHPDIQKIRKAVEVFNSWLSSFVDFEDDEEDDEFEGTPTYREVRSALKKYNFLSVFMNFQGFEETFV